MHIPSWMRAGLVAGGFAMIFCSVPAFADHDEDEDEDVDEEELILQDLAIVKQGIERNFDAIVTIPDNVIEKLPPPPPPPGPANPAWPTWVGVRIDAEKLQPDSDRPALIEFETTEVSFLNPGNVTANVGCTFFSGGGSLFLDRGTTMLSVPPGNRAACRLNPDVDELINGWVLISSDRPILPDAYRYRSINRDRESQVELYPIDCREPDGLEFVCGFVNGGQPQEPF